MSPKVVVGIDVGGSKKGFHLVNMIAGSGKIRAIRHCQTVADVTKLLTPLSAGFLAAIDCPPRCQLVGERTRLAERQLHQQSFRVQWTRRGTHEPAEWMQNGQALWETLARLPGVVLIETFPTVATASLATSRVVLPLHLLAAQAAKRDWKDFVDAAICAEVGDRYLRGEARFVGSDPVSGEEDELGPIWF